MSDFSPEISDQRISVSPELGKRLAEAKVNAMEHMQLPDSDVAVQTEQMGLLASFGNLYKEMIIKKLGIGFKDVKAVLGIVPFVPLASEAIKVVKAGEQAGAVNKIVQFGSEMNKAAKLGAGGVAKVVDEAILKESQASKAQKAATKAERWAKWFKGNDRLQQKAVSAATELGKTQQEAHRATQAATMALTAERARGMLKEGKVSEFVRRHIVHDISQADYVVNYDRAMKSARKLTETEAILKAAGREIPARNFAESIGKRAVHGAKHGILHGLGPIIDPTPDVPGVVVLGSFGAELLGLPLAALIAPVWQAAYNRYESMKVNWETAKKAKEILRSHFEKKMNKMKEPQVAKAAEAFLPNTAKMSV